MDPLDVHYMNSDDISIEYHRECNEFVGIPVISEPVIGITEDITGTGIQTGPDIYPPGRGLEGTYIRLLPGIGSINAYGCLLFYLGMTTRIGDQWVFDSGFVPPLCGGALRNSFNGVGPHILIDIRIYMVIIEKVHSSVPLLY